MEAVALALASLLVALVAPPLVVLLMVSEIERGW